MDSMFLTSDLHRVSIFCLLPNCTTFYLIFILLFQFFQVLELDATKSSHSIVVDVDTPDQINAVSKSSSICKTKYQEYTYLVMTFSYLL